MRSSGSDRSSDDEVSLPRMSGERTPDAITATEGSKTSIVASEALPVTVGVVETPGGTPTPALTIVDSSATPATPGAPGVTPGAPVVTPGTTPTLAGSATPTAGTPQLILPTDSQDILPAESPAVLQTPLAASATPAPAETPAKDSTLLVDEVPTISITPKINTPFSGDASTPYDIIETGSVKSDGATPQTSADLIVAEGSAPVIDDGELSQTPAQEPGASKPQTPASQTPDS